MQELQVQKHDGAIIIIIDIVFIIKKNVALLVQV